MHGIEILSRISENREEWLGRRAYGSSDVSTIAGLNVYRSPLDAWAERTGKRPAFEGNDYTELGSHMEDYIAKLFTKRTGLIIAKSDSLYSHPEHTWATASPDFLGVDEHDVPFIVECKNTSHRHASEWSETDAPTNAVFQLQWQLGVLGIPYGYIAGLIGGDPKEFYYPRFDYDQELFEKLIQIVSQFKNCVDTESLPDVTGTDSKLLDEIFEPRTGAEKAIEANDYDAVCDHMSVINHARKEKKEIEVKMAEVDNVIKVCQNSIKVIMGKHSVGLLPDGRVIKISTINVPSRVNPAYSFTKLLLPKEIGK